MRHALAVVVAVIACATASTAQQSPEPIFERGPGIVMPKPTREVKPSYTPDAMREGVQGRVLLRCVVRSDGSVGDITVAEALHPDLDRNAVESMGEWAFTPGTREGKPVAVRIEVEMTFTLK